MPGLLLSIRFPTKQFLIPPFIPHQTITFVGFLLELYSWRSRLVFLGDEFVSQFRRSVEFIDRLGSVLEASLEAEADQVATIGAFFRSIGVDRI